MAGMAGMGRPRAASILLTAALFAAVVGGVQAVSYQTVARFDCKMTLGFEPNTGRFLFDDGATQHFSACTFESYMWHHAMVSIDAAGVGQLFVDGDAVLLGSLASDGTTFTPSGASTFTTATYANKCPDASSGSGKRRRGLLAAASGAGAVAITMAGNGNPTADQKVGDGYPAVDAALDPASGGARCKVEIG